MNIDQAGAADAATEDFAAFEASLDQPVADKAPAAAETEKTDDPPADDAGAQDDQPKAEGEGDKPEPKPKQTAQQRIDQLTYERRELERQNKELLDRLSAGERKPEPAPTAETVDDLEPDPADYEGGAANPDYIADMIDYRVNQRLADHESRTDARATVEKQVGTFDSRAKDAFPEGEPDGLKAFRAIETIPVALNDIILTSENGPKLAAHYGENPAELERLSALAPHLQAYEIAKVEAGLTATAATPKQEPKVITDAPEPAPKARGAGGHFKVAADTDDFAAFDKAYP